jgi:hypothetical protein
LFRIIIILFLFLGAASAADKVNIEVPVSVTAEVDRNAVNIGDKIKYTITVRSKKGIDIEFPEFGDNLVEFAIKDFGSSKRGLFGRNTLTQWYILDTFETGSFTIPSIAVKYKLKGETDWKEFLSEEVAIEVKSALNEEGTNTAELQDIKGPLRYRDLTYLYILLAVVAAVIIISAVIFILKKRTAPKQIILPPRPAHEIAYEALRELENKNYPKTGRIMEYYTSLSGIVRRYLENRFRLRAPEMTTEEFLYRVRESRDLNSEQKGLLGEFLSHCDMVKFAKYSPETVEINKSHGSARRLIDQTKSVTSDQW